MFETSSAWLSVIGLDGSRSARQVVDDTSQNLIIQWRWKWWCKDRFRCCWCIVLIIVIWWRNGDGGKRAVCIHAPVGQSFGYHCCCCCVLIQLACHFIDRMWKWTTRTRSRAAAVVITKPQHPNNKITDCCYYCHCENNESNAAWRLSHFSFLVTRILLLLLLLYAVAVVVVVVLWMRRRVKWRSCCCCWSVAHHISSLSKKIYDVAAMQKKYTKSKRVKNVCGSSLFFIND